MPCALADAQCRSVNHVCTGFNGGDVVGDAEAAILMTVPVHFDVSALITGVLDDLLVDKGEEFLDPVGGDVPARITDAEATNTEFHRSLVDHLDILGVGTGGVLGDKHHRNIVLNGVRNRLFHGGHQFLHGPALGVLANRAGAKEG